MFRTVIPPTRLSAVFILSTFQYRLSKRPAKAKHPEGLRFTLTTYILVSASLSCAIILLLL